MSAVLWEGPFGDDYTGRNRVDWSARVPFWNKMLRDTRPQSVLEVGCNAGWNMRAIRGLDHRIELRGVDVNQLALTEARFVGLNAMQAGAAEVGALYPETFDLVFTCGVLIHIPPDDLGACMGSIARATRRWVLAIEYGSEAETEVEYRGQRSALWRRPFGELYQDLGLHVVEQGVLLKPTGFDNCTYWLLKK